MKIALAGNPNSGKTSLFNYLTGSRQHVGNWPGVTVEKKEGFITVGGGQHMLIDLPGIYTLDPDTIEQRLTRDFIFKEKPDLIINILDASNLQRNLYFTLQLRESGIPMIITLNMMDEVEKSGTVIHMDILSKMLGVPVVGISASKGIGIDELLREVENYSDKKTVLQPFCLGCSDCSKCKSGEFRYGFIDGIISKCVENSNKVENDHAVTAKIDKFVLNKYLAFPIFFIIMLIVFSLTFGGPVTKISDGISFLLTVLVKAVSGGLAFADSPKWVISLVCDGVIPGIGTVLTFLPQIAILFILMALLEDSGYMARGAIMMDRVFASFGLSGSSFIPMIIGFGCTVPAVMSCRILPSEKDRRLTILLTSFISCSARLPLYALMTMVFFAQYRGIVIMSIYMIGIVVAIAAAIILNKTILKSEGTSFVMEVPPYRLPNPRSVLLHTWERVKGFLVKAGTIILAASVVIWFFQSFGTGLQFGIKPGASILAAIGRLIAPIFVPLGFGSWQAATSLITGIAAKELVVTTFSVLTSSGGNASVLHAAVGHLFTPLTGFAFMCFTLLYAPCVSAITTMKRELNSWKWLIGTLALDFSVAWIVAFIVFNAGRLIGF
jgi:ferrous iron transport protein B